MQKRTRLIRGNFTSCSNTCSTLLAEMDTTYMKKLSKSLNVKTYFSVFILQSWCLYKKPSALSSLHHTHTTKNKKLGSPKKMKLATQIFFCGFFIVLVLHTHPATSQEVGKTATLHMHWILILFSINETCMYVSDINGMENKLNSALIFFNFLQNLSILYLVFE